ncbi:MAG: CMP deaminase [Flavobacteriia bacterium]|nr:CMP deaminase [Flavobacteriia bacterium]
MPIQQELDEVYLKISKTWSTLSKAKRQKVGCLIVKNGSIISDGYNGTPKGFDNKCEMLDPRFCWSQEVTKPEVLHAESNAITKLAKSTQSSVGATMYITISPCVECAKLIIQSGITRVVFGRVYKNLKGVTLLKKAKIEVTNYESTYNINH